MTTHEVPATDEPTMSHAARDMAKRYGLALAGVAVAALARWSLTPLLKSPLPFPTFYLATTVTAVTLGLGPALVTIALGAALGLGLFLAPGRPGGRIDEVALVSVGFFVSIALVNAILSEALRSARRRALDGQEALRREAAERRGAEARFVAFMDNSPAIGYLKDESGRYVWFNRAWRAQFDRPGEDLAGVDDFSLWDEATARTFRESDRRALEEDRAVEAVESVGDRHFMSLKFPLDLDGRRLVGGMTLDVTDRIRAERAAEAANAAKDRFLAVLSHELRTPLAPILLAASALPDEADLPESARSFVAMVRQNVALEARLIDDLLDLTRIARGPLPLRPEPADAHALLAQAVEICRAEVSASGLDLALDLSAHSPFVSADPARLQQAFWNLVKNAVKFTPSGGSIRVATRSSAPADGPAMLAVEVSDTGVGIDPAFLPRAFDPFEQGDPSARARRFGGLGLGLSIARSIVEGHGGSLTASSAGPGLGSTFLILLPTIPAPAPAPVPPAPPVVARGPSESLRILVVEDDPITRSVLARLLRLQRHDVTTADSVASALATATGDPGRFDLIISDIGLPDGTGVDLMRSLQALRPTPAIALTGHGMEDDILASRAAGFRAHLTKPIDFRALESAIAEITSDGPHPGRIAPSFIGSA